LPNRNWAGKSKITLEVEEEKTDFYRKSEFYFTIDKQVLRLLAQTLFIKPAKFCP